ncbi:MULTISPECIES: acyltransferase [unclassified Novosphingobium]|uniref:acyltransferase family protein n=1 Tax=unclassified Novosphingobium TaxID=2644732 RepID=UPI0013573873|nr:MULTISPECIES: acyltransferase [unclassified Novosphingobium]
MQRLDAVQGLRAVAAWFVVIAHGAAWAGSYGSLGLPAQSYDLLGSLGVLMFFTVSGFIMVYISRGTFGMPGASVSFLQKRLIRIVPLYWLMTMLALAVILRNAEPVGTVQVMQSLLFIPYIVHGHLIRPLLGVGWTLNFEMFFYVLFAVSLLVRRGLMLLCCTLGVLLLTDQILNPIWRYHDPETLAQEWTDPLLLPFLLGIGLAVLHKSYPSLQNRRPFLVLAAGCVVMLILQQALVPDHSASVWWRIAVLALGAVLASSAILASSHVKVPRWLILAGDSSYSLYLVHPLLFGVVKRIGGEALARELPIAAVLFYVLLSTAAGLALHVCLERPLTRWLGLRLPRSRQAKARLETATA